MRSVTCTLEPPFKILDPPLMEAEKKWGDWDGHSWSDHIFSTHWKGHGQSDHIFPMDLTILRDFTQAHLKCWSKLSNQARRPREKYENKERFIRSDNKNKTKQQYNNNTKVKKNNQKNKITKKKKKRRICSLAPVITLTLTLASPCLFQTQSVEISDTKIQDLCTVV